MRGDSIRDLYAKGLALVGLGMLAGAGAIVDYWPTRGSLPIVVLLPPRPDFTLHVRPAPADLLAVARSLTPTARRVPVAMPAVPSIRVSVQPITVGQPVALLSPTSAPEFVEPAVLVASAPPVSSTPAGELLILPPPATPVITASSWSADAEHDAFFITGAVKRTGASIVRTSVRTGASVVDAVRTLGGAFRRALPN